MFNPVFSEFILLILYLIILTLKSARIYYYQPLIFFNSISCSNLKTNKNNKYLTINQINNF